MRKYSVSTFTKGWFIGDFSPSLVKTAQFETALKIYRRGDREAAHRHVIAREFTVVGSGRFRMNQTLLEAGDIVELTPGEVSDFECIEGGVTFVVKIPSAPHDKEIMEERT